MGWMDGWMDWGGGARVAVAVAAASWPHQFTTTTTMPRTSNKEGGPDQVMTPTPQQSQQKEKKKKKKETRHNMVTELLIDYYIILLINFCFAWYAHDAIARSLKKARPILSCLSRLRLPLIDDVKHSWIDSIHAFTERRPAI